MSRLLALLIVLAISGGAAFAADVTPASERHWYDWLKVWDWPVFGRRPVPDGAQVNQGEVPRTHYPYVAVRTARGDIYIDLYEKEAPQTVNHFLDLVESNFYNVPSMQFHRVVPGFVIQTGDPTGTGYGGGPEKLELEVKNRLSHDAKGVVAMARGVDPNSATSQFYITLAPQKYLDGKYAIFGHVIRGMEVLDKIKQGDGVYEITTVDSLPPVE